MSHTDPFTTPFTCASCGTEGMEIDAFPGKICLTCHAAKVAGQPMPTATEIVNMWR